VTGPVAEREITVGETLPPFTVALTLQRLVMEAAANRDFAPIHFDPEAARDSGAPNVYANTTFVETLLEAAIRTWAGLDAWIRVVEFSMKAFNCVGDEVTASGVVTGTRREGDELTVDLDVWVESSARGRTVIGSAVVAFPLAAG
jgi:acyl dehydratase